MVYNWLKNYLIAYTMQRRDKYYCILPPFAKKCKNTVASSPPQGESERGCKKLLNYYCILPPPLPKILRNEIWKCNWQSG